MKKKIQEYKPKIQVNARPLLDRIQELARLPESVHALSNHDVWREVY